MIEYEDELNDKIMSAIFIASAIVPLIGIIAGIITSIIKNKIQGLKLIIISICFTLLNITIPVFGSAIFGIFMLVIVWRKPNPICPCCEKIFPRFTGKLKNKYLKGGWICPECGCNVDKHGKKETDLWNSLKKSESEITVSDKNRGSVPAEKSIDRQAAAWRQMGFTVHGVEAATETVRKVSTSPLMKLGLKKQLIGWYPSTESIRKDFFRAWVGHRKRNSDRSVKC